MRLATRLARYVRNDQTSCDLTKRTGRHFSQIRQLTDVLHCNLQHHSLCNQCAAEAKRIVMTAGEGMT